MNYKMLFLKQRNPAPHLLLQSSLLAAHINPVGPWGPVVRPYQDTASEHNRDLQGVGAEDMLCMQEAKIPA